MRDLVVKLKILSNLFETVSSGRFLFGQPLYDFERKFAQYIGAPFALGVKSGADALVYALKSLGIGPGDEVITTAIAFASTPFAVSWVNATPVFVDIEPETFNIDPAKIEERITKKTKAIAVVHLHGCPAAVDDILCIARKYNLWLIEDSAHALGARFNKRHVGTFGDVGCFSFAPWDDGSSSPLSALGDAGAVTTWNRSVSERLNLMRQYGGYRREWGSNHLIVGGTSCLDSIQASALSVKLDYLAGVLEKKRNFAGLYSKGLEGVGNLILPRVRPGAEHSFYHYVVRTRKRDELRDYLAANGIVAGVHYRTPVPYLEALKFLNYGKGDFPVAEKVASEVLTFPTSAALSERCVLKAISLVKRFFK